MFLSVDRVISFPPLSQMKRKSLSRVLFFSAIVHLFRHAVGDSSLRSPQSPNGSQCCGNDESWVQIQPLRIAVGIK